MFRALACSKRSDSGERCEVKKAIKSRGGLGREGGPSLTSPPPSPFSQSVSQFVGLIPHPFHIGALGHSVFNSTTRIPYQDQKKTFNYLVGE